MAERGLTPSVPDRRRVAAGAALFRMKGERGWRPGVDDSSLDFLASAISEQMMLELASTWRAQGMGYPTSSKLAALAESLHLRAAVTALDR
jgi:hypothetical protein